MQHPRGPGQNAMSWRLRRLWGRHSLQTGRNGRADGSPPSPCPHHPGVGVQEVGAFYGTNKIFLFLLFEDV